MTKYKLIILNSGIYKQLYMDDIKLSTIFKNIKLYIIKYRPKDNLTIGIMPINKLKVIFGGTYYLETKYLRIKLIEEENKNGNEEKY